MRIVVHGANWIGDAVMTIPALRELRRVFPEASITLYSRPWAKGIFQDCDFVDEIVVSESGDNVWREADRWRALKFDAALLFTNSFRTALLSKLALVPFRFGYANEARGMFLSGTAKKPSWKDKRHEVFSYLALSREFEMKLTGASSISDREPDPRLTVSTDRLDAARQLLSKFGADPRLPTVGFGVGSQNSNAKRWMPAAYAELIDLLVADPGINVVLLGSDLENAEAAAVSNAANSDPINLVGKTGLADAVAVISLCKLFVSNDMGLAHASSAVGTKTLTIFGPTNPLTTRPWNGEIIRREDVHCSPCMLRECPIDHRCMQWIKPSEVFKIAKPLLDA